MDIFKFNQLVIARKTLRLSDASAKLIGGMTKVEAARIIREHKMKKRRKRCM